MLASKSFGLSVDHKHYDDREKDEIRERVQRVIDPLVLKIGEQNCDHDRRYCTQCDTANCSPGISLVGEQDGDSDCNPRDDCGKHFNQPRRKPNRLWVAGNRTLKIFEKCLLDLTDGFAMLFRIFCCVGVKLIQNRNASLNAAESEMIGVEFENCDTRKGNHEQARDESEPLPCELRDELVEKLDDLIHRL